MSADYMSKAVADAQFEQGEDVTPERPLCDGCECEVAPLFDYHDGRKRTPLMLCEDCCRIKSEHENERQASWRANQ